MRFTNKLGLPQAIYDAIANDPYDNGGAWRSVTQLVSPPRLVVLKKRHDDEIEVDIADCLYALYGQIVHLLLERANVQNRVEERLFVDVMGRKISGAFDSLQVESGRLIDWKFSTVWKAFGLSFEWEWQMNLLATLFEANGTTINELEIVLMMRDWSKPRARRESDYPQTGAVRIPVPLWGKEKRSQLLKERVMLHIDAEDKLPLCSSTDRWERSTVYAVMKKGGKKAVAGGLYETMEDAVKHTSQDANLFIQERQGESVRCADYCLAAPFCSQLKDMRNKKYGYGKEAGSPPSPS